MKNRIVTFIDKHIRELMQLLFILLCLWIGVEFINFVSYFKSNGVTPYYERPPGVDGFLPISSLMNLLYFIKSGIIHPIHPAGFFIFLAVSIISFAVGKSFCSWFCFIGTISEQLGNLGERIFGRRIELPKYLDIPLRSLKYLLLLFFLTFILSMGKDDLKLFLDGDYNVIADIKMYYFFAHVSIVATVVILILVILSIPFRSFWCRYLCPYGALLGVVGLFSPLKIRRTIKSCIDCNRCTQVCPSKIKVAKVKVVISDECTSCLKCISSCPVDGTLQLSSLVTKKVVSKNKVAIIILVLFISITGFGIAIGQWQNNVSKEEYMKIYLIRDQLKHH